MTHAMPPPFSEHPLPAWRRAVLKVGSSLLAGEGEGLSPRHALNLAQFVSSSIENGYLWVDVVWDDGTLQDAADAAYGEGVVVVRSALRD